VDGTGVGLFTTLLGFDLISIFSSSSSVVSFRFDEEL
jgi:hypothetical protein